MRTSHGAGRNPSMHCHARKSASAVSVNMGAMAQIVRSAWGDSIVMAPGQIMNHHVTQAMMPSVRTGVIGKSPGGPRPAIRARMSRTEASNPTQSSTNTNIQARPNSAAVHSSNTGQAGRLCRPFTSPSLLYMNAVVRRFGPRIGQRSLHHAGLTISHQARCGQVLKMVTSLARNVMIPGCVAK